MCRVGTLRAEVHRKSLVARPIRDDTHRRVFRIPGSSTPATVHNAMFPTSASFFGRSSPIEFDDLGSDERAVGQLELRARRVGQRCHSARGPVQERAARGEGPRTASRLPAFLGSGAAARLPSLVCKQILACACKQKFRLCRHIRAIRNMKGPRCVGAWYANRRGVPPDRARR